MSSVCTFGCGRRAGCRWSFRFTRAMRKICREIVEVPWINCREKAPPMRSPRSSPLRPLSKTARSAALTFGKVYPPIPYEPTRHEARAMCDYVGPPVLYPCRTPSLQPSGAEASLARREPPVSDASVTGGSRRSCEIHVERKQLRLGGDAKFAVHVPAVDLDGAG